MKNTRISLLPMVLLLAALPAAAQAPMAGPLSQFDKLAAQLKPANVVGEPVRAGNTFVVPFARLEFELAGGDIAPAFAGGAGAKTVPLGILIVEGDDVRVETFPEPPAPRSAFNQILQAVLDKKVAFMVNGLNAGNLGATPQDLSSLISAMMGQNTVMVNGLNIGNVNPPKPGPAQNPEAALAELKKSVAAKPTPEGWFQLGEALRKGGQKEPAAAAYKKALELRPNYPDAAKALASLK